METYCFIVNGSGYLLRTLGSENSECKHSISLYFRDSYSCFYLCLCCFPFSFTVCGRFFLFCFNGILDCERELAARWIRIPIRNAHFKLVAPQVLLLLSLYIQSILCLVVLDKGREGAAVLCSHLILERETFFIVSLWEIESVLYDD